MRNSWWRKALFADTNLHPQGRLTRTRQSPTDYKSPNASAARISSPATTPASVGRPDLWAECSPCSWDARCRSARRPLARLLTTPPRGRILTLSCRLSCRLHPLRQQVYSRFRNSLFRPKPRRLVPTGRNAVSRLVLTWSSSYAGPHELARAPIRTDSRFLDRALLAAA